MAARAHAGAMIRRQERGLHVDLVESALLTPPETPEELVAASPVSLVCNYLWLEAAAPTASHPARRRNYLRTRTILHFQVRATAFCG